MPNIVFTKLKKQPTEKALQAKIFSFIPKLTNDDTSPGVLFTGGCLSVC